MTSKLRDKLFIGGGWTPGRSVRTLEVVNVGSEKSHTGKDLEAHCQMEEPVTP
jgi:hypothetical protein